ADPVDRAIASRGHEPCAGVVGYARPRPSLGCRRKRVMRGFLGEIEIAEEADQGREDPSPLVAEDVVEGRHRSTIGRTSTAPPIRAAGMRAASSIAASM